MSIKALFVDLGGVLILNKGKEIGIRFETEHGLKKQDIQDIFRFIQAANRTEQEIDSYLDTKGITRKLWDSFTAAFFNSEERNENLCNILNDAKLKGIIVVYTTNNSAALESIIDKFGVRDIADIIINSSATGVAKPENNFWQLSLNETKKILPNITAENILVVDDSETNCNSAKDFGFQAIVYKPGMSDAGIIQLIKAG